MGLVYHRWLPFYIKIDLLLQTGILMAISNYSVKNALFWYEVNLILAVVGHTGHRNG
jgi:hypothetical protein